MTAVLYLGFTLIGVGLGLFIADVILWVERQDKNGGDESV